MFNQIFILDLKGKVLVARNYRGELDSNVIDKFMSLLMERGTLEKLFYRNFHLTNDSCIYFRGGRQLKSTSPVTGLYFRIHQDEQSVHSLDDEEKR